MHYGISEKSIAKWKKRTSVSDLATGPKEPKSTILSLEEEATRQPRKKFKSYPIGYFHIDIAEFQTAEGKRYLFVAIRHRPDVQVTYVELHDMQAAPRIHPSKAVL